MMAGETVLTATPYNAVTGNAYAGGNILRLMMTQEVEGYDSRMGWAGFQQWRTIGRTVRKGEKGTSCLTVVIVDRGDGKNGGTRKARGFSVFHYDQTEPLPESAE